LVIAVAMLARLDLDHGRSWMTRNRSMKAR
jgi:hypothetical protein